MTDIYGTLGPACCSKDTLIAMFNNGMTGIRLNLSHTTIKKSAEALDVLKSAAEQCKIEYKLLVDMQGPELRIGDMAQPLTLETGKETEIGDNGIPIPDIIFQYLTAGQTVLLDDGKIALKIISSSETERRASAYIIRGGVLSGRKSIAIENTDIPAPALTDEDLENISDAGKYGVYAVMQPFVRSKDDLINVRAALNNAGCSNVRIFAKIENKQGINNLQEILQYADEIVIARGDLGNAMPLWQLPAAQKMIAAKCRSAGKPFMVVTQMLASMENSQIPTRAEVSDIFNAVCDGASSVMVTGETASGRYPDKAILYLANTAKEAEKYIG